MFPLDAAQFEFEINYTKPGKKFVFKIASKPISDEDMIRYDRIASSGEYVAGTKGELEKKEDQTVEEMESELFAKYVQTVNARPLSEVLPLIPQVVKSALLRNGFADVWVDTEEKECTLEDLQDNAVEIKTVVNGDLVVLKHAMKEPTSEDELQLKRLTRVKAITGRKKSQFAVVADCQVFKRLYDKLVIGVAGYSMGGVEVNGNIDIAKVPYIHKKVVIQAMFGAASREEESELGQ